jgi:hypothetical protein
MSGAGEQVTDSSQDSKGESWLESAGATLAGAVQVAEAWLALLKSELRLARRSAIALVWLGFALVFVGAAAWLSTCAAIAVGIYQLTGNVLIGVAAVALANMSAAVWIVFAMRRCWRDVSLPETRAWVGSIKPMAAPDPATTVQGDVP